ncbi:MAG TPA: hypothetical protein VFE62_13485 [Gemmataceae bacterium]|nr:hypothetical protein [Gemmataceae bacterium]
MDRDAKLHELETLRTRTRQLETELGSEATSEWPPRGFYGAYAVLAGCVLGSVAAMASLLFNVVGSLIIGQFPLQLIRVYLTFPLGAEALQLESGLALAIGCCLYLLTGMVFGVPFQWILSRWFDRSGFIVRFIVTTVLGLALWGVNFHGILSWMQPLLIGGSWIVDEIPWWVAMLTHLVFGWAMLLLQPFGRYMTAENKEAA